LRINRQQFHRYLSGDSEPSLRKLRSISDYFGLEDSEILLGYPELQKIILRKNLKPSLPDPFGNFIAKLHQINPSSTKNLEMACGYYYTHTMPVELSGRILRGMCKISVQGDYGYIKTMENYSSLRHRARKSLKYTGVVYHTGKEIYIHEREMIAGRMIWNAILNPIEDDQFSIMTGLALGVTSSNQRSIASYRVLYERLDSSQGLRKIFEGCGVFDADSDEISASIRQAIRNDVPRDEGALVSRHLIAD